MKSFRVIGWFVILLLLSLDLTAQCSICTKTAQQMGEGPAKGLNSAIIYLMLAPFGVMGYLGYRWWTNNRGTEDSDIG